MRKIKENMKLLSCLLWIAVSVGTLFISIVSYTPVSGEKYTIVQRKTDISYSPLPGEKYTYAI